MENYLFPQKFFTEDWLSSSPTSRAISIILAFICGLGIFFLLRSCLQPDPSSPPPRKKPRTSRKYHAETRRRSSRSKKKNQTLKVFRDCLQDLEEVHSLVSLLQSHLARLSDQGGFHQFLRQAAPGQVRGAAPAGAPQPCRGPVEDAAPAMAPSPSHTLLTEPPRPLASTLPADPMTSSISVHSHSSLSTSWPSEPLLPRDGFSPQPLALPPSPTCLPPSEASPPPLTAALAPGRLGSPLTPPQCDSRAPALCPIPQSSSPHSSWLASPVPALSGLSRSSCPISALSWWQAAAKAWNLSTSTRLESHQAPLSHRPPEALFWGDPVHRQGPPRIPPFINPDVQKLLEILIAKRTELKVWKEKEKKEGPDCHLTSFGRMFKSPGDKPDGGGCQPFWGMRGKPKQLLGPEKPPHPKISGDNLEQKCSQLFWGLPFLHSESLVATVRVAEPGLQFPSVIFNELSQALPLQMPACGRSRLSLTHSLPDAVARPQHLTRSLSRSLPLPLAQPPPAPRAPPPRQPLPPAPRQPLPLAQPLLFRLDRPHPLRLSQSQPLPLVQPLLLPLAQPQPPPHPLAQPHPPPHPLAQPQPPPHPLAQPHPPPLPLAQPQPPPHPLAQPQPPPHPLAQPHPPPLPLAQPQPPPHPLAQPHPPPLPLAQPHPPPHPLAQPQPPPHPLAQPHPPPLPLAQPHPPPLPLAQPHPPPLPLAQPHPPPHPLAQSQPPPLPLAQPQPQAHLAPSVPVRPPSLPPGMGTCEAPCPVSQKTPSYIPTVVENLECHLLRKQVESVRTLPTVVKRSQEVFSQAPPDLPQDGQDPKGAESVSVLPGGLIDPELREQLEWHLWKRFLKQESGPPHEIQLSVKVIQSHEQFQKAPQARSWHSPTSESESTDEGCPAAQNTGSRYPWRTLPGKSLSKESRSSAGRIQKDLHRGSTSSLGRSPERNSEESDTDLKPSLSSADEDPRAYLGRKSRQTREGQSPSAVHHSRLPARHAADLPGKPSPHRRPGRPAPSKGWEPYMTTSHDFSILSPYTQRMLEAHIIRFRVKHRWGLPLKVLKPINLFKLKRGFPLPRSSTPRLAPSASNVSLRTKFSGGPPQPYQEEVLIEVDPTWGGPLGAPQPPCEEMQQALDGSSPGSGPLAERGARPPSRTFTCSFVGRVWHSETSSRTVVDSSLESSPSPATATQELRENEGRASPESRRNVTVLELSLEAQDLRAKEPGEADVLEEAPAWADPFKPGVLASRQDVRGELRRSGSLGKSGSSLPPAKLVAQDPEGLGLEAQTRLSELRKLAPSTAHCQDSGASVLLQDCETGVLLQDCATESLLQDCQSNVFLAADILASQGSLSGFHSGSSEDTSTSQGPYGLRSRAQSGHGQLGPPPGLQPQCKSLSQSCVPPGERASSGAALPREPTKELSELKVFQISEMRQPIPSQDSAVGSGGRVCEVPPQRDEAPPESYFRRRVRHLLRWFFPTRGKGREDPLQRGRASSSQSRARAPARPAVDSASAEVVVTAVGRILEEKMVPHHALRAPEVGWCKRDLQAAVGPNICYHRVLSYQEQRRVMRETAASPHGGPKAHSCTNRAEWVGWPFLARVAGFPGRPCPYGSLVPGPSGRPLHPHCPRHCLLQRYASPGQSLCASHAAFPGRTTFLREKMQVQRKTFFSQVSTSSMG